MAVLWVNAGSSPLVISHVSLKPIFTNPDKVWAISGTLPSRSFRDSWQGGINLDFEGVVWKVAQLGKCPLFVTILRDALSIRPVARPTKWKQNDSELIQAPHLLQLSYHIFLKFFLISEPPKKKWLLFLWRHDFAHSYLTIVTGSFKNAMQRVCWYHTHRENTAVLLVNALFGRNQLLLRQTIWKRR